MRGYQSVNPSVGLSAPAVKVQELVQTYRKISSVGLGRISALSAGGLKNVIDVEVVGLFDGRLDCGGAGTSSGEAGRIVARDASATIVCGNAVLSIYTSLSVYLNPRVQELDWSSHWRRFKAWILSQLEFTYRHPC